MPLTPIGLSDEQRSAVKQNTNPVVASKLRLSEQDMSWWRDAKFGMFIHWGLYAIPAQGEWVMHNKKIPADEYAKLADQFVGAKFDASQWVKTAQSAGMKYMVMVTRHHDGFALWDSPSSYKNFTSVKSGGTAHRDFVREYVDAAHAARMRVRSVLLADGLAVSRLLPSQGHARQRRAHETAGLRPGPRVDEQLRPDRHPLVRRRLVGTSGQ